MVHPRISSPVKVSVHIRVCACVFVGVTHSLFNIQLLLGYYYDDDDDDYYY